MGWAERMGAAVVALVVAAGTGSAGPMPPRLEGIDVRRGPSTTAVVVRTTAPHRAAISSVRAPDGSLQRVYLDFPAGAVVAPGMPRGATGAGMVRRVAIGLTATGALRVLIAVDGAHDYVIRRPPEGSGIAVVFGGERSAGDVAGRGERPAGGRALRVVVDPGHGGDDPGASGAVTEKEITLAIALELARLLRTGLGADVTLTRHRDESVSLRERTRRANLARADLFVSIHANASTRRAARGVETYYLDNTEDQATLRLAAIENGRAGKPTTDGTSLDHILSSLVQGGKQQPSVRLAARIQRGLVTRLAAEWPRVVDLGVKRGPFYVLVGAYMPCVLVEASFLTHAEEGRRLADPSYRRAVAEGIFHGIAAFARDDVGGGTL